MGNPEQFGDETELLNPSEAFDESRYPATGDALRHAEGMKESGYMQVAAYNGTNDVEGISRFNKAKDEAQRNEWGHVVSSRNEHTVRLWVIKR